jgi:Flp pilus assembly protein CpaB
VRKVRAMIALLVSIALAGLAAYVVYRYLGRPTGQPTPTAPPSQAEKKAPPAPPKTLSQRIEPGMRAVTLEVDDVTGGSRELAFGDRVDILAVTPIPEIPEGRVSRQLISGAMVMAVGVAGKPAGRHAKQWTVTLAVTPEEAATLSSADPAATLRIMIRNPGDGDTADHRATAFTPSGGIHLYTPQKRDLGTLIAPGKRAMTLDIAPTDGVGGIFEPDDRVDIIVTCVWGNLALQSQDKPGEAGVLRETHRNSRILMQNIKIIATDRSLVWDSGANRTSARVILEVSPAQAEQLTVLADSKKDRNIIRLISRNQHDHQQSHTAGAELLDLISDKRPYQRVELIRGSLRKDQTFYR